jgi:hypothetical protein
VIKTRLRYCVYDPDPNGNDRYYVRKSGRPKIRIRESFEDTKGNITPEFMKAYFDALAVLDGTKAAPKTPRDKTFSGLSISIFARPHLRSTTTPRSPISAAS